MAKTLTLEEAAQKLGLTPEQFKVNLKTHKEFRNVRPLMGGATMHFREQDVDELARRLGMGSDSEVALGAAAEDDDQIEIGREAPRGSGHSSGRLSGPPSSKKIPAAKPPADVPLVTDSSEDFVPIMADKPASKPDSGAKLGKKSPSDSDVKLEKRGPAKPADSSPTEEVIDLDDESQRKAKRAKSGEVFGVADDSSMKLKAESKKDSSEFELKLGATTGPGSSSEFELTLSDDGSDEVELGSMPRDVSGKKGGSGVKLNAPADSGISLEKDSDSEFELNLESSSSAKMGAPKSDKKKKAPAKPDSDSEFELTLDDSSSEVAPLDASGSQSDKDIFETDFDIPALDDDSASEAVALEEGDTDLESSDFDLATEEGGEESASEVVELDEGAETVEEAAEAVAEVDEQAERRPMAAAPAKWGAWSLVPLVTMIVMFVVTIMTYELVHSMWGFHQPANRPTSAVTRGIAGLFNSDSELPKEP